MNLGSKRWMPSSLHKVCMEATEIRNYPYYIIVRHTPPKGTLRILVISPSDECPTTAPCLASTLALRTRCVSSASKSPKTHNAHRSDRCSPQIRLALCCSRARIILRSWLCGSTKEPIGFVVNHYKPYRLGVTSTTLPLKTWLPWLSQLGLVFEAQPRNYTRFRLAHPCHHAAHT
jgi:hypothetical protein